jgi:hypothetical protein
MQRGKAERCLAKCIGEAAASSSILRRWFAEVAARAVTLGEEAACKLGTSCPANAFGEIYTISDAVAIYAGSGRSLRVPDSPGDRGAGRGVLRRATSRCNPCDEPH